MKISSSLERGRARKPRAKKITGNAFCLAGFEAAGFLVKISGGSDTVQVVLSRPSCFLNKARKIYRFFSIQASLFPGNKKPPVVPSR
jgi:hypothetical protein